MKINHPVTDREVLMKEGTILVTKTDLKGRIIHANDEFVEISGFSRDELIGANHNIVRHPDMPPEAFADLWHTLKQGQPWRGLVKNRNKQGDYYWVEANVTPISENGQIVSYLSARYAPSRDQIRDAEQLYAAIRNKTATLRPSNLWSKLNLWKRMKIAHKLWLTVCLLLLPALIMMAVLNYDKNQDIEFTAKELRGLEYIGGLSQLAEQIGRHRSLSSKAGNDVELLQARQQITQLIANLDATESKLGSEFHTGQSWKAVKDQWQTLLGQAFSPEESYQRQNQLLEELISLMGYLSDQSNLTLDPAIDSYYLMDGMVFKLPELADRAAQLRDLALTLSSGENATVDQRIKQAVLENQVNHLVAAVQRNLAAASDGNAELKPIFANNQRNLETAVGKFFQTANQIRTNQLSANLASQQLSNDGNNVLLALTNLSAQIHPELQKLLDRRVGELQLSKQITFAAVTIVAILSVWVGLMLVRYLSSSLANLRLVFSRISEGDFKNKVNLDIPDELGEVMRGLQSLQVKLNTELVETRTLATSALRIERALDNVESCVMVANNNREIIYMNKTVQAMFKNAESDIRKHLPNFDASALMGANIDQFHRNPSHQASLLGKLDSTFNSGLEIGGRHMSIVANPVKDSDGSRIGTVVEWRDRTKEVMIEQEIENIVDSVKSGDLSARINLSDKQGFFAQLSRGINELTEVIDNVFRDIASTMQSMSEGNLTNRITSDYQGVYLNCKEDINTTIGKLSEIVAQVSEAANFINNSSQEIASGNNNLSQRAEQQAANLEETAASMEQLTSTVKNNAENAQQADHLASSARQLAEKGGEVVTAAVSAMREINESSTKIADIIGVIDEIAFQTNLLALNASVEAARAGEQGRGFSVVATEVRNLAQRSATAARESKDLIQTSVQKVRTGTEFVNETGKSLSEIVASVKKVGDIIAQIAAASVEQSSGIGQVNQAVSQMDEITQQNAALAQEASAASVSMSDLSSNMVDMLSFFKLEGQSAHSGSHRHTAHAAPRAVETSVHHAPAPASKAGYTPPSYGSSGSDDEWQDF